MRFAVCILNFLRRLLSHPRTLTIRRIVRRTLAISSVILAVVFVLTLTMDVGPQLRERAEVAGSNYLKRSMHIGYLGIRLWRGSYVVRDLVIDGMTPQSRPWLVAKQIEVFMQWRTLVNRQIVLDSIDMSDWNMYVEQLADGRTNFPSLSRGGGRSRWTTTLKYVRAHRGEFAFDDQGTPWSVTARNIDVTVSKPNTEYRGSARFSNGLVAIQSYVPFRADMDTTFKIDGGRVIFDAIHLTTDGTKSELKGDVDLSHWPEQMYSVKSTIDLPRMRQLFFANDKFELAGTANFDGYFHLFKGDVRPDGKPSGGRELKGNFTSATAFVNDYRFDDLRGYVRWIPTALEVHDATANLFGGHANFEYSLAPLGQRGVKPANRFEATYAGLDLTSLTDFFDLRGMRLAGRMSGRNLLEWPSGRFADRRWTGDLRVDPPAGTTLMTRELPVDQLRARAPRNQQRGEFSPNLPKGPIAVGGTLAYALGPEWVEIGPSQIATATTFVNVEGQTAYGERSRLPFHVSSSDWQDSDRVFAALLTAFGSRTKVIPVDGYGTFDGVMRNAFRQPRIEGTFVGYDMRAFDVTWGAISGEAVIENAYADVKNVVVTAGESAMSVDGRFSLGYPRRDGGEQIDARIRLNRRPVADLKHAFGIEDYNVDGNLSGDFHVTGEYERPFGYGMMTITDGGAYGEKFETADASVRLEGDGVRLESIQIKKGQGGGTGNAFVSWNGTYSFTFDGMNIGVETLTVTRNATLPLSGIIDFTAAGSGAFARPEYTVHGTIKDFFIADEGIGTVVGDLTIADKLLTMKVEAASTRLAVTGSGTIALTDAMDADLTFTVVDTSLDPYVRAFQPRLSPYTTAVASGTLHVYGELSDINNVLVDASVERFDARLFDYALRNPDDPDVPGRRRPIRIALDRQSVRVLDMRLVGQDTQLDIAGAVDLHNQTVAVRFSGSANLQILEGFTRNVRTTGRAVVRAAVEGSIDNPILNGSMTVEAGRFRHFSLPHALDDINGVITFDSRGVHLDEMTAKLGEGPVTFAGSIGIEEYRPGRVDVTMTGENMRLRYPQREPYLRALVDAQMTLEGTVDGMTLAGNVAVRDATYSQDFRSGGSLFDLGSGEVTPTSIANAPPTLPLAYDIRIRAPSNVTVRNNLLQRVVATADLRLQGTYERPVLLGNIDVERGEVLFEGKRYVIRRGSITLNNPTKTEPYFDVQAETRIRVPGETYIVTIDTAGTDPVKGLHFSSDPSLPDYQLFALLFSDIAPGRDIEFRQYSGVTPQEQLLRDRMTRALTGTVSAEIGRAVQEAFAVDTFQCTPSLFDPNQQSARLDPSARCTVGKRLSERIFFTYSRSLSSTTRDQVIVLEIDQTDQLSWILSRNEDGTYALDLRVRRTF